MRALFEWLLPMAHHEGAVALKGLGTTTNPGRISCTRPHNRLQCRHRFILVDLETALGTPMPSSRFIYGHHASRHTLCTNLHLVPEIHGHEKDITRLRVHCYVPVLSSRWGASQMAMAVYANISTTTK